jgi:hypothetical protein
MSTEQKYFDEMLEFDKTARSSYDDYDAWFQAENVARLVENPLRLKPRFQKPALPSTTMVKAKRRSG